MGKTDLGKWMITNGGEYSADATYEQLTMVKYGNSTYITLKTVTGITPTDDKINYQLMAQGFDATALSAVQAEDTQGLCGEKGEIVTAQSLVDALADKVMNTVMAKIGTAALTGGMTDLSSGVNSLYSNLTGKDGAIKCDYATLQYVCKKFGNIVVAHGRFTTTKAVPANTNPFITLPFKPAEYAWPALSINGIQTGNVWLNTLGNVGINFAIDSGKSGHFTCVYIAA